MVSNTELHVNHKCQTQAADECQCQEKCLTSNTPWHQAGKKYIFAVTLGLEVQKNAKSIMIACQNLVKFDI